MTVALSELSIGPFRGELHVTVYAGSRLVHVEAVVSTTKNGLAILYDAGLLSSSECWKHVAWMDTSGELQTEAVNATTRAKPLAVRHRAIMAEGEAGTVALFPPPQPILLSLGFLDESEIHLGWSRLA